MGHALAFCISQFVQIPHFVQIFKKRPTKWLPRPLHLNIKGDTNSINDKDCSLDNLRWRQRQDRCWSHIVVNMNHSLINQELVPFTRQYQQLQSTNLVRNRCAQKRRVLGSFSGSDARVLKGPGTQWRHRSCFVGRGAFNHLSVSLFDPIGSEACEASMIHTLRRACW